ncbi:molecular chaperone HtpG [Actinoalloteichus sp. AHMU CJ021]|uniref:Chaperone protein HtpG n=1 Tax=Actinoalloteichus caeruleus DSM 43889 TaxID=1120930 RepID=A0ABT1JC77_ACTCY|nr:molecular chaperone HtpG [Actinoalloteichus caeruleus]AUS80712.1 molecular chaperone HtpG [Actinoalloteichus sp. AHMU CJ021]MCP2330105.1 molecular chaperone HtpG [Actinoalloteichus caeruleus DSM 43889]
MNTQTETLEFQAETRQLLQLMVHSIYSSKDIFLRELISNSSDALDKLRLASYADKDLDVDTEDLHIHLSTDGEQRTLTVRDNGIGMSRDELVENLGTIAKSGTAEFLRKLRETRDANASEELIGQFGVGFYSCFMVADRVTVVSRRAGETVGTRWESTGEGTYTLESVDEAPQGTTMTLHLKPVDEENALHDYAADWKVKEIVRRYSDFITWPIRMDVVPPGAEEGAEPEPTTINSRKALWARSSDEVSEAEYSEFYKHLTHDWSDPLDTISVKAEGTFEYQALLFLPSRAPMDLFMREGRRGLQLYVKRVFIMGDCEALLPEYLRFVKGVVDAQDLSLNVSREILQQDRQIQLMRRRLVKRVLGALKTMMAEEPEKYRTFWKEFGSVVKEGLLNDAANRDAILDVVSFHSTNDAEATTSLREYVERMKDGQEEIYYLTGRTRSVIENSPHLEGFQAKGLEVLMLTDAVDEMWVDAVGEFDGRKFRSVAKGQADLKAEDDEESGDSERDQRAEEFAALLSWMGTLMEDNLKEVRLSSRLTTSPACLVGDEHDVTPELEKLYRAMGQDVPHTKRILELNPAHPLVSGLRKAHEERADDEGIAETAELLYGMALLAEGGELSDPPRFTRLLADRLASGL